MRLEFLVEEESAEKALNILIPKIVGEEVFFQIHSFQGKGDLLRKLPDRLRGYRNWIPEDWTIVVLVDKDNQDCRELKSELNQIALREGFAPNRGYLQKSILNRIAIEELEAWFFGDLNAVAAAYPRVKSNLSQKAKYRIPDAIDGTWEALERILKRAGYYSGGMPKTKTAEDIAKHMVPEYNTSHSFQIFKKGLEKMVKERNLAL